MGPAMNPALRTPLCPLLGIEVPILQAGMGFVARGELAAAVSEAGALGVIGGASLTAEELREEIHKVRARTERPFGVDLLFAVVEGRFPSEVEEQIRVVLDERVPVLASGLGDPGPVVDQAHALGMKVVALVGNTRNARKVAASGVDVIVAQGYDGGGHTGRVGTLALVPAVLDTVEVPVVAAGGIGDGRGLAAMLAIGAVGVWMGTRFVASREATGHKSYKQAIVQADDESTIRTRCFSGKPARMIRNRVTAAWEDPELQARIQRFPRQLRVMQEWLGEDPYIAGRFEGKTDIGALAAGQSSALIRDVLPAGDIVRAIVSEASRELDRLGARVQSSDREGE